MSQGPKDAASKNAPNIEKCLGADTIILSGDDPIGVASQLQGKLERIEPGRPVVRTYLVNGNETLDEALSKRVCEKWKAISSGTFSAETTLTEVGRKMCDKVLKAQE